MHTHPALHLHQACLVEEGKDGASKVTFLYKLRPGDCPKSYGMNVARLAHMPEAVIERANAKSIEFEGALLEARAAVAAAEASSVVGDVALALQGADAGDMSAEQLRSLWTRARMAGTVLARQAASEDTDVA